MTSRWVSVRGSGAAGTHLRLGSVRHWCGPRESGSVFVMFSPYLYRFCSCFPLFAVLLNCPYPDPPVSACFFPFSSARQQGEGRPRGAFVAGGSRNQNRQLGGERALPLARVQLQIFIKVLIILGLGKATRWFSLIERKHALPTHVSSYKLHE